MSVPKQRHTKGRRNRRRANIKISKRRFVACSHCKKTVAGHKACPYCGYYKGKNIVAIKKKKTKKTGRKK
jgi:large subunit ribosomal protein L32